jgi:hypothetical protein
MKGHQDLDYFQILQRAVRQQGAESCLASSGTEVQSNPNTPERTAYLETPDHREVSYSEERFEALAKREGMPDLGMAQPMLGYAERHNVSVRGFNTAATGTR